MVKKLLIAVFLVAILAVSSGFAVRHYHQYKQTKIAAAHIVAITQQEEIAAIKASDSVKYNLLQTNYTKLQAECQKGLNAYAALTPATKAKLLSPNCTVQGQ